MTNQSDPHTESGRSTSAICRCNRCDPYLPTSEPTFTTPSGRKFNYLANDGEAEDFKRELADRIERDVLDETNPGRAESNLVAIVAELREGE